MTRTTLIPDRSVDEAASVYFAYHVPKCAGTTVDAYILRNFPDRMIKPKRMKAPQIYWNKRQYAMPSQTDMDKALFVSGHWIGRSFERNFEHKKIKQSILLRDPLGFYLSYFNYRMKRYQSQGLQGYSFDLFYKTRPLNPIAHFILTRVLEYSSLHVHLMSSAEKLDRIKQGLEDFWFVGSYKDCDRLLGLIAEETGGERDFTPRNTNPHKLFTKSALTEGMKQRILEENSLDQALYQLYCEKEQAFPDFSPAEPMRAVFKDLQRPVHILNSRRIRSGGALSAALKKPTRRLSLGK